MLGAAVRHTALWLSVSLSALTSATPMARSQVAIARSQMVNDWSEISSSSDLQWTPCFGSFSCSKLDVPLNYDDESAGTAAIAILKLPAQSNADSAQSLLINNGGPGGSPVGFIMQNHAALRQLAGPEYNLVGIDPRGVNNSGPVFDCFRGNTNARKSFLNDFYGAIGDTSDSNLEKRYSAANTLGSYCSDTIKNYNQSAKYLSSPAVAQDMLTFAKAENRAAQKSEDDAKVWFYGLSYGTVLGTTFAGLFPDRVGRLILDGVMNANTWYNGQKQLSFPDSDKAVASFSDYCHQAGAKGCAFWGPTPQNITTRLNNALSKLQANPLPVTTQSGQKLGTVTYSDLLSDIDVSSYTPLAMFPKLAMNLAALEQGNGTSLLGVGSQLSSMYSDAEALVGCEDWYGLGRFNSVDDYKNYVQMALGQTKYFGAMVSIISGQIYCNKMDLGLPQGPAYKKSLPPSGKPAFPILFAGSEIDPATPISNAEVMAQSFEGSTILTQKGVGHTGVSSASSCFIKHVQSYLGGQAPSSNTTCEAERIPFKDGAFVAASQ